MNHLNFMMITPPQFIFSFEFMFAGLYSFCVTSLQFKGSTPSACWNKIYKRIKKVQISCPDCEAEVEPGRGFESGSDMYSFSHPEVSELIMVCHMNSEAVFL